MAPWGPGSHYTCSVSAEEHGVQGARHLTASKPDLSQREAVPHPSRASSGKTRRVYTQLDKGPETPGTQKLMGWVHSMSLPGPGMAPFRHHRIQTSNNTVGYHHLIQWMRSLKNPRDGGAWWAAVYGVAQSRTRLKSYDPPRVLLAGIHLG